MGDVSSQFHTRTELVKKFDDIRNIRNDVMHFDPEGIDETSRKKLKSMANFLNKLEE